MKVLKHLPVGFVTVAMLGLAQASAFAATSSISPQAVNSSAPCWQTTSTATSVTVFIGSNGHCTTSTNSIYYMGQVKVSEITSTDWNITVTGGNCDNIGDFWKAHEESGGQYNLGDVNGCSAGSNTYQIPLDTLATTSVNWWVTWGGYNSPAFAYPLNRQLCLSTRA